MTLELLFPNFDQLIRTPEDVQRLNEAILQLAVQGKLVPQDPNDEPASVLLERITQTKQRLIAEKVIRKPKKLPPILSENKPFALPLGWIWCRIEQISQKLGSGSTPRGGRNVYVDEGVKFLRSQNVWNDGLRLDGVVHIPESVNQKMANTVVTPGDILLNITGASIGRAALVPDDFDTGNVSQHVAIVRMVEPETRYFIHSGLISPLLQRTIMDVQVGISREGLSMTRLREFLVPLPPLAEQKRIVAKVDQLFAQTRALEAKLRRAQEAIVVVNQAALHRLDNAGSDAERRTAWATVRGHFDRLYDDPRCVQALRQTILQLAVQGKLVPQDPNDEPASVLMTRIEAEKKRLADAGEVAKPKRYRPISQAEMPFPPPVGWDWCRVQELGEVRLGRQRSPKHHQGEYMRPYLRAANIKWSGVDLSDVKEMDFAPEVFLNYRLRDQDILLNEASGSYFEVGKSIIWHNEIPDCCFQNTLIRVRLYAFSPEYLRLHFECDARTGRFGSIAKGMSIRHLGAERLAVMPVALPPLAEQKRIVAKIDQLMALCDALEAKLSQGQAAQANLTAATLYHALDA